MGAFKGSTWLSENLVERLTEPQEESQHDDRTLVCALLPVICPQMLGRDRKWKPDGADLGKDRYGVIFNTKAWVDAVRVGGEGERSKPWFPLRVTGCMMWVTLEEIYLPKIWDFLTQK